MFKQKTTDVKKSVAPCAENTSQTSKLSLECVCTNLFSPSFIVIMGAKVWIEEFL